MLQETKISIFTKDTQHWAIFAMLLWPISFNILSDMCLPVREQKRFGGKNDKTLSKLDLLLRLSP